MKPSPPMGSSGAIPVLPAVPSNSGSDGDAPELKLQPTNPSTQKPQDCLSMTTDLPVVRREPSRNRVRGQAADLPGTCGEMGASAPGRQRVLEKSRALGQLLHVTAHVFSRFRPQFA